MSVFTRQSGTPSRTLMRPPVVKRQTTPRSGLLAFFPPLRSRCRQQSVAGSDGMSVHRCQPSVAAPHTYGGSIAIEVARAESDACRPLRPSNIAVPAYRPTQKRGAMVRRPCVPGAGEGQHPATLSDSRRLDSSGGGVQANAQGQDQAPRSAWAFGDAVEASLQRPASGWSPRDPVRLQARRRHALLHGAMCP